MSLEQETAEFNMNGDLFADAQVDAHGMDWQKSPANGVWRKRLEHFGSAEQGRVTSLVRFEAGATFSQHGHPQGEEILVLNGVFSDETGDYGAGSYVFNPEGFVHAPWTVDGCELFVRLRHHQGTDRAYISLSAEDQTWVEARPGVEIAMLLSDQDRDEHSYLVRLSPGTEIPDHGHDRGEEIYVIEGALVDADGRYPEGTWKRFAADSRHAPQAPDGALLYVRTGYLPLET